MYCTKCGHKNPDESKFCALCGTNFTVGEDTTISLAPDELEIEDEVSVAVDELQRDQGLLVVTRGQNAGSRFLLDKDVTTAGRHPSSDIFLNDITVSRRHAEILREGERFVMKDVGSLNGSYVNRQRVDVAELSSGDELQIGKFKLVFFTPKEA
jgi:FHA domain-containing protein/zinc ribbon protein